jgi:hypothetical protein
MSYWITTHWPHPKNDDHPWYIYLREKDRDTKKTHSIKPGDEVLFYQTKLFETKGKDGRRRQTHIKFHPVDPQSPRPSNVELADGAGGIVRRATILDKVKPWPADKGRYIYDDDDSGILYAPCGNALRAEHPITPKALKRALGMPPENPHDDIWDATGERGSLCRTDRNDQMVAYRINRPRTPTIST